MIPQLARALGFALLFLLFYGTAFGACIALSLAYENWKLRRDAAADWSNARDRKRNSELTLMR
jgi:hypothetical protein